MYMVMVEKSSPGKHSRVTYYYYKGVTTTGSNQRYYITGGGVRKRGKRGKTGKQGKVGVKRKWRALAQPPYSLQGNGRQSPKVG